MKKKKGEPKIIETVGEPAAAYYKQPIALNRITFSNSFEEQENSMRIYWASITPIQRLKHLNELITISFGLTKEKLAVLKLSNRINFNSSK